MEMRFTRKSAGLYHSGQVNSRLWGGGGGGGGGKEDEGWWWWYEY